MTKETDYQAYLGKDIGTWEYYVRLVIQYHIQNGNLPEGGLETKLGK